MGSSKRPRKRRKGSRQAGECVVHAFAVASQMALLYPTGIDEWVRLEVEGRGNGRPPGAGGER